MIFTGQPIRIGFIFINVKEEELAAEIRKITFTSLKLNEKSGDLIPFKW